MCPFFQKVDRKCMTGKRQKMLDQISLLNFSRKIHMFMSTCSTTFYVIFMYLYTQKCNSSEYRKWHCRLGHLIGKIVHEMTYNMSSRTFDPSTCRQTSHISDLATRRAPYPVPQCHRRCTVRILAARRCA